MYTGFWRQKQVEDDDLDVGYGNFRGRGCVPDNGADPTKSGELEGAPQLRCTLHT